MIGRSLHRHLSCLCLILLSSCAGCPWRAEEETVTSLESEAITLQLPRPPETAPVAKLTPPPTEPDTPERPTETAAPEEPAQILEQLAQSGPPPVPPGTYVDEALTMRLKEKMAKAYGDDITQVPDLKIYLSNGSLEEMIDFYEERGYQPQRISVPIRRILQPVLRDKPELADRIRLEDYDDMVIHQVMIEGTGISAADKYIDPDTYEVIERVFVTEMPMK